MAPGLWGLPWALWAGIAFGVAVLFGFVAPGCSGTTGLRFVVLRWFHPLTWLLLGISASIRGSVGAASPPADLLARLALVTYVAYVVTFVSARRGRRGRTAVR